MRAKSFHITTFKEPPSDSDITSYSLMIRSGMIKKLSSGIYSYMPIGLRVLRRIENIIREEMNYIGGIEILTPIIQPAELWKSTNRWESLGKELLRVKDRHDRDFIVQPTSEEVFTDMVKQEIKSWKKLPKIFYQIQTKFRDERRPRFGIMRAREFVMKDAYSFDINKEQAYQTYEVMLECYKSIFKKMGLTFRVVKADSGNIGGPRSNEFQVIAETGEDKIAFCKDTDFSENVELAEAISVIDTREKPKDEIQIIKTPNSYSCKDVASYLKVSSKLIVKSLLIAVDSNSLDKNEKVFWLVLLRSDHNLNEFKLSKINEFSSGWKFAKNEEIKKLTGASAGSIGPVKKNKKIKVIADKTVANMSDFIVGANEDDFHFTGVNWKRDIEEPDLIKDIRDVVDGDPLPNRLGKISIQRGIEVGHVFYLGNKYSKQLGANVLGEDCVERPIEMGCYGIGVSRLIAASIEQNHDLEGIVWPKNIAPFSVVICPIGGKTNEVVKITAQNIYKDLVKENFDVILDDREERPGIMFAEWELIGIPLRITVGPKSLVAKKVELYFRDTKIRKDFDLGSIVKVVRDYFD
ncbi:MAG: proline--tRNA ligase [Betaproteobacteria bacterium TMED156]|nr:MAG: proline--tRNA ligase [Betaproteobacteria bacterium TMED156]